MLHIFKGRESLHKRALIYERIASQEHFSTLLTPAQNTLSLEKEYLELTQKPGIFFEEVTSFERMRTRLCTEIFSMNESITPSGERILLSQLLREKRRELPILGRAFSKEGLLEELRGLFGRFLREGVMPEDLEDVLKEERESLSHRRLQDLHHLYQSYVSRLQDKYFDIHQSVELFEREGHRFSLYSPHSIWVLGYKNLGLPEIRMLQAMEAHTGIIYLSLPCEEEELYAPILELIHRLKSYFVQVEEETIHSPDTPLVQFARGVTGLGYQEETFPVRVLEARDPYSEAEYIGLDILRRMREDRTLRPEDIRILTPDPAHYGPVFSDVFSTLEIPLFRDERRLILHTRMMKAVFSLLRSIQRGFPSDMTLNYLKNIVPPERWEELDIFENIVLRDGITKSGFEMHFSDEAEALRRDYLSIPIAFSKESLPKRASTKQYCAIVLELLEKLNFSGHIDQEAQMYQESAHFEEAMVLTQIWNVFYETLEQLTVLSDEEPVTFPRFITRLRSALGTLSVAIIPPSSSEVSLSDLSRSLSAPVRLLYVCGVNEGLLPGDYSRHLLLDESQREKVAELVPGYTDLPLLREQGEELDFYTQIALTKDHMLLSYSLSDIEGNEQLPSLYINRALEMTGEEAISGASEGYLDELYWLHETMSLRYAMNAYAQKRTELIHGISEETLSSWLQRLHSSDSPAPIERRIQRLRTSASGLETFSSCPFRYFLRYDLKAKERKFFRVERADLGSFYHEIVEKVVRDMVSGESDLDQALERRVEELLLKKQYAPFMESAASEYFLERAKAVCRIVLKAIKLHLENTDFLPTKFEHELRFEGENFSLYGIADRIDQKDQYFLLIDYKSGEKSYNISRIYAGVDLQLSLYTMGLEKTGLQSVGSFYLRIFEPEGSGENPESERLKQLKLSGAILDDMELIRSVDKALEKGRDSFVLPVRINNNGKFSKNSSILTQEEHQALLQTVLEHSEDYAKSIVLGDISVAPLDIDGQRLPCSYCEFLSVCRFEKTSGKFSTRKVTLAKKEDVITQLRGGEK